MTAPIFKPFVYVELPVPSGYSLLPEPGVHMNNDGVVVATMNNGSANYGYLWFDEDFTTGWYGPIQYDSTTDLILADEGISSITANSQGAIYLCGTCIDNTLDKAFFMEITDLTDPSAPLGDRTIIGSGYARDVNEQGVVVGTSLAGHPVAWWDIVGTPQVLSSPGDLTNALGVTPNTLPGQSLVAGQAEDASDIVQAALWYFDGNDWQVLSLSNVAQGDCGAAIDVSDDGVVIGALFDGSTLDDTVMWYYDEGESEWTQVSLSVSPLFTPEAINNQANPEIVGGESLLVSTDVSPVTGHQLDLTAMSLGFPSNMIDVRCTDINDAGEIVGVGQLGSLGPWTAFKLVPYDVNNNGQPDFREIIDGSEADSNDNWLIDWAETDTANAPSGMRLGLHGPGDIAVDGKIDPVQIVRLKVSIAPHGGLHPEMPDGDDYIDQIVDAAYCTACSNFTHVIDDWGTGDARPSPLTGEQSEILVRVHSMMGNESGFGTNEGLPEDQNARDQALDDLQTFGYRFAHCIDYLQWGNESFGGSGGYLFREDDLTGNCTWTGAPKSFVEIGQLGGTTTCQTQAVDLVLAWQDEMMWAALRGSALAGRPLRMVTTGLLGRHVREGYDAGNAGTPESHPGFAGYYVTDQVSQWANSNQMYTALHVHYITVAQGLETIQKLVDTYQGAGSPWDVPNWRMATEVGTKADFPDPAHNYTGDTWWNEGTPSRTVVHNEFFKEGGEPGMLWEEFISDWEDFSDHFASTGFGVDDVLAEFADAEFAAVCWSCLQFGSHTEQTPSPFFVEALRADKLTDDEFTNEPNRFTPLKSAYVTEGAAYYIDDLVFTPHSCACDSEYTCPDCP
ncbi:MAG: hypothetical protein IT430_02125 [Phycisphaerales bacterium]|nr:hypothetical protein [Phycisphaerales bacterium]